MVWLAIDGGHHLPSNLRFLGDFSSQIASDLDDGFDCISSRHLLYPDYPVCSAGIVARDVGVGLSFRPPAGRFWPNHGGPAPFRPSLAQVRGGRLGGELVGKVTPSGFLSKKAVIGSFSEVFGHFLRFLAYF